jgi:hypothetical protein
MSRKWTVLCLCFATASLVGLLPAAAAETQCVGVLTGVHDNVVVPSGAHCEATEAQIRGNVKVQRDASFRASDSTIRGNLHGEESRFVCLQFGSQLGGNFDVKGGLPLTTTGFDISVQVGGNARIHENQGHTFIDAAIIGGNVEVMKNTGSLEVEFNTIGGNARIAENVVPPVYTGAPFFGPTGCGLPTQVAGMSGNGNRVEGNMEVIKNVGPGTKQVQLNTVLGHLNCFENSPPFVGSPNTARKAQGQCAAAPLPPGP